MIGLSIAERRLPAVVLLDAALDQPHAASESTPCRHDPDAWFDGNAAELAEAAARCADCPIRLLCAAAGEQLGERPGVWGGIDRTTRLHRTGRSAP